MERKPLLTIALVSILVAAVVVVVLRLLEYENPTVIAGGVAGGIAGAISSSMFRKKTSDGLG